jgi:hypothetical protein
MASRKFEIDRKITPIFTIIFSSKMLIRQCFTPLEHTFLVDGLDGEGEIKEIPF